MPGISKEQIQALKDKHPGELLKLTQGEQAFVVRAPAPAEYRRAMDKIAEEGPARTRAIEQLGRDCCIFPPADEFAAILEKKPGVALMLGGKALSLSGVSEAEEEKL